MYKVKHMPTVVEMYYDSVRNDFLLCTVAVHGFVVFHFVSISAVSCSFLKRDETPNQLVKHAVYAVQRWKRAKLVLQSPPSP
jgi:hypothetical protein